MDTEDRNEGPIFIEAWRRKAGLSKTALAEKVGTNSNMIGYLEAGERGLSAKWLRRFALQLNTTPGILLDYHPDDVSSDIVDLWIQASPLQRRQIINIAKILLQTNDA